MVLIRVGRQVPLTIGPDPVQIGARVEGCGWLVKHSFACDSGFHVKCRQCQSSYNSSLLPSVEHGETAASMVFCLCKLTGVFFLVDLFCKFTPKNQQSRD